MEKYMGYRARETIKENDEGRKLPIFEIAGTGFSVDIVRGEFRQVDNPANRIMMQGVKEQMGFSHMLYDTQTKNVYLGKPEGEKIPEHVRLIIIPPLKDLDGVGLARRQGLPDGFYGGRGSEGQARLADFRKEEMVNQKVEQDGATSGRRRGKKQGF